MTEPGRPTPALAFIKIDGKLVLYQFYESGWRPVPTLDASQLVRPTSLEPRYAPMKAGTEQGETNDDNPRVRT